MTTPPPPYDATVPPPRHRAITAAPKAAPVLATSTVLILARVWNANGAEHSVGDAILMGLLASGAAVAGGFAAVAGSEETAAVAFTASGALAAAAVAAYAHGIAPALLLWAIATGLAYVLAARTWRDDRRDLLAHERRLTERREEFRHTETVEIIRARAQVETARESGAYAAALAQALTARAALPGFDPKQLEAAGLPALPPAPDQS